jgi:hypothetical protein
VETAAGERWREVASGEVVATAIDDGEAEAEAPAEKTRLHEGRLEVQAPCRFCDYGLICGLSSGAV